MYGSPGPSSYGPLPGPSSYGRPPGTAPPVPEFGEGVTAPGWYQGHKLANGAQRIASAFIDYYLPSLIAGWVIALFHWGAVPYACILFMLVVGSIGTFGSDRTRTAREALGGKPPDGQSLGKWLLGITAVQPRMAVATSQPFLVETSMGMLLLRALLHIISFPLLPISVLLMCIHVRRQSIADRVTGTIVIAARPSKIPGLWPANEWGLRPEFRSPRSVKSY